MVQAATLVLAAFAVAPVFSAPLSQANSEESFTRSVDIDSEALELREPFKLPGFLKKVGGIAKTVGKYAVPAARLLLRDAEGNLYEVRTFDGVEDFSTRDLVTVDIDDLDAREPKFRLGSFVRRIGGVAGKVGGVASKVAGIAGGLGLRELEDGVELDARDILDMEELLEREFTDLDTREPKFRLGRFLKKAGGIVGKVGGVAGKVAGVAASLALRDELEGLDLDARDYQELEELLEREFADLDELEIRDPKFRFGNLVRKIGSVAGKVGGVAGRVAGIAGSLGLRDLEDMETETREVSIDELD